MATQPKGRQSLARETPTLRVGQEAPDFELPTHDGKRVKLSDLRGKRVVLAYMVHAFTGG